MRKRAWTAPAVVHVHTLSFGLPASVAPPVPRGPDGLGDGPSVRPRRLADPSLGGGAQPGPMRWRGLLWWLGLAVGLAGTARLARPGLPFLWWGWQWGRPSICEGEGKATLHCRGFPYGCNASGFIGSCGKNKNTHMILFLMFWERDRNYNHNKSCSKGLVIRVNLIKM